MSSSPTRSSRRIKGLSSGVEFPQTAHEFDPSVTPQKFNRDHVSGPGKPATSEIPWSPVRGGWRSHVGLRTVVSFVGGCPLFLLLTAVPAWACMTGVVQSPDILLSDVMAASPLLRSLYTTGMGMEVASCIVTWGEVVRWIKSQSKDAELRRALDQFLAVIILCVVPTTLTLVSFTFEEASPVPGENDGTLMSILPQDPGEFTQWLTHVLAATLCFIGLGFCAALYLLQIEPKSRRLGLEPAHDLDYKVQCARWIVIAVACGGPIRVMHVFQSRAFWCWPLLGVELLVLNLGLLANVLGTHGVLAHLDETQPMLSWRNLTLGSWVGTVMGWPAPKQVGLEKLHTN